MIENEDKNKKEILDAIHGLSSRMDEFGAEQQEIKGSIQHLTKGQETMQGSIKSLEDGQQELHEMVHDLATQMDERFERVDQRFGQADVRFERIESTMKTMVTKDYLDDKFADHGSRYGELIRKTNGKIEMLTDSLVKEKSLSVVSAKKIVSAEPFGRR